jgi:hypothetical protein
MMFASYKLEVDGGDDDSDAKQNGRNSANQRNAAAVAGVTR